MLNRAEVTAEGTEIRVHVGATREQIEATLASVQLVLPSLSAAPTPALAPLRPSTSMVPEVGGIN